MSESTESAKTTELKLIHEEAIRLRLLGFRHDMIAQLLGKMGHKVTYWTVRDWFSKKGPCQKSYQEEIRLRTARLDKDLQEAEVQLKEGAIESVTTLRSAARGGNIRAAESLLDRSFPKKSNLEGVFNIPQLQAIGTALEQILGSPKSGRK